MTFHLLYILKQNQTRAKHFPIMITTVFSQKEDDNNSGSGHPPKKKPTRLAIGESIT